MKKQYSNKEKKAYYMGLGMGLTNPSPKFQEGNLAYQLMKTNERKSFNQGVASGFKYSELIKASKRNDFVPFMSYKKLLDGKTEKNNLKKKTSKPKLKPAKKVKEIDVNKLTNLDKILATTISGLVDICSMDFIESLKLGHSLGLGNPSETAEKLKRNDRFKNKSYLTKLKQVSNDFYAGNLRKEDEKFFKAHIEDIPYVMDFNK